MWSTGGSFSSLWAGCAPYYATPAIRLGDEPWIERTLYLRIGKDTPGVSFPGDWDPMGMRATVSRDLLLQNVFVPDDAELLPPGLFGAMYNAFPHPLPELLRDLSRAHASCLRRRPRVPDRPDAGRADLAYRDRGEGSCDSRDALFDRVRPRDLLPRNLGG
jgi:hypothetical protein